MQYCTVNDKEINEHIFGTIKENGDITQTLKD